VNYRFLFGGLNPMTLHAQYTRRSHNPAEFIEAVEFNLPLVAPDEALLEVLAAPINPADLLTLSGYYAILPSLPAVGGMEGVGRVVEIGSLVTDIKPGQLVLLPHTGTWSTHMIAPAGQLMTLPEADPLQLAMLAINPPTAWLILNEYVNLLPGDWVIQNAANSAVGSYLFQLARLRGLKTVNIVRREGAVAAVQELGADLVLVDGEDIHERVAQATSGAPIRLGVDGVGGTATRRLTRCLAESATLVNYGGMSGEPLNLTVASLVFRDLTVRGCWVSRWMQTASVESQTEIYGELASFMAGGQLKGRIQAVYPLSRIRQAIAAAASGERDGKIIIVPDGSPAAGRGR
jgi:NADPH:quinone reductase-like Zn-dependent oxidoreductase